MKEKTKNRLVFFLALLLAGAVYAWFFPMNRGTFTLQTGAEGYEVFLNGEKLPCQADPCATKLKAGTYEVLLQKEQYAIVRDAVTIRRGKTAVFTADLKRVYTLERSMVAPNAGRRPAGPPAGLKTAAGAWNGDESRYIFLDAEDERVKIWQKDADARPVTLLKNLPANTRFFWSPGETHLLVQAGPDLYFMNTAEASRKKRTLAFTPAAITWGVDAAYLNDAENQLYRVDPVAKTVEPAGIALPLSQSAWKDEKTLIYFESDAEKRRTDVKTYDPASGRQVTLTVKFDFVAEAIHADKVNNVVFVRAEDKSWYELK